MTLVCTPEEFMDASFNDRIRLVQKQIHQTPQYWDQTMWAHETECGTTYCFAGWACNLAGYMDGHLQRGGYFSFHDRAGDLLGLTEDEATNLFHGTKTFFHDLDAKVDALTAVDR